MCLVLFPYVYFFGAIFSRVVAVREYLPPREADINKWDEKQIAPLGYAVACGDLSFQLETADLLLGFRECNIYIYISLYIYIYICIYIYHIFPSVYVGDVGDIFLGVPNIETNEPLSQIQRCVTSSKTS